MISLARHAISNVWFRRFPRLVYLHWSTVLRTYPTPVAWTLYGLIQPFIDVYLSQETFEAVQRSFPYLISEKYASGGGDVRICPFPSTIVPSIHPTIRSPNSNGTLSTIRCLLRLTIQAFRYYHLLVRCHFPLSVTPPAILNGVICSSPWPHSNFGRFAIASASPRPSATHAASDAGTYATACSSSPRKAFF